MGYPRSINDPSRPVLRAVVLVAHGSRDHRPRQAVELLASRLSAMLAAANVRSIVAVAQLEGASTPLHQQLVGFAQRARSAGAVRVEIIPLFLSMGVHATVDVPEEVALATQSMGPQWGDRWQLYPPLGVWPGLDRVMTEEWRKVAVELPRRVWVLVAHGSRNPLGNQLVEQLAEQLGLTLAYWAIAPTLLDRLTEFAAAGHRAIGIFPYFLFAGSLTDALFEQVYSWQRDHTDVDVQWLEPIGPAASLVRLMASQLLDDLND